MKILGITDDRTECDCCGKVGLKCTVALEHVDSEGNGTGEIVYFGRDCAARKLYGNNVWSLLGVMLIPFYRHELRKSATIWR